MYICGHASCIVISFLCKTLQQKKINVNTPPYKKLTWLHQVCYVSINSWRVIMAHVLFCHWPCPLTGTRSDGFLCMDGGHNKPNKKICMCSFLRTKIYYRKWKSENAKSHGKREHCNGMHRKNSNYSAPQKNGDMHVVFFSGSCTSITVVGWSFAPRAFSCLCGHYCVQERVSKNILFYYLLPSWRNVGMQSLRIVLSSPCSINSCLCPEISIIFILAGIE